MYLFLFISSNACFPRGVVSVYLRKHNNSNVFISISA